MRKSYIRNEFSRRWRSLPIPELARRMIEIYSVNIAVSAVFTAVFVVGMIPGGNVGCIACAAACLLLNLIWLAYRVRQAMKNGIDSYECRQIYLKVHGILAGVNVVLAFFELEPIYTWMFLSHKVFAFGFFPRVVSAILVNGIMFIACLIFPSFPRLFRRTRSYNSRTLKMRNVKKMTIGNASRSNRRVVRRVRISKKGR